MPVEKRKMCSFRLSPECQRKLEALAHDYGNKTTVVEIAIARLHDLEQPQQANKDASSQAET